MKREDRWRQIESARQRIDEIDAELVALLNLRAEQALRIGHVKSGLGEPIYQPDREHEVFERVVGANDGPLEDNALRRLFERILDESRRLERMS